MLLGNIVSRSARKPRSLFKNKEFIAYKKAGKRELLLNLKIGKIALCQGFYNQYIKDFLRINTWEKYNKKYLRRMSGNGSFSITWVQLEIFEGFFVVFQ